MGSDSIVISGMGIVSALGCGVEQTLAGLRDGTRNAGPVTLFDSLIRKPAFQAPEIDVRWRRDKARTQSLALAAAAQALSQARLPVASLRVGVCMGTTVACQLNDIEFYARYRRDGEAPMDAADRYFTGNPADVIAREFGFSGPTLTVVNACSSGTDAIGIAMSWLESGRCDAVVAGGADELNRVPYAGFNSLGVYSDEPCMPFDRNRSGLNLGEGAGVLVLEKRSTADARGADTDLHCLAYATFADAWHLTAPASDGASLERAIRKALSYAGIGIDEVDMVNAHGTATMNNDLVEGNTLARIFGNSTPVSSTKGYTGHTLGAAGGIEAIMCALALRTGWVPATAGLSEPDPAIALRPTMETTPIRGRYALSTSLAFGGNNSALVISRQ